jgi:putative ABC transport system ATP-binding protein
MTSMVSPNGREHAPLIRLDRISKSFLEAGRDRVVLHEVSAAFETGEFVVLIGKSGSGKSTLHERTLFRRRNVGFIFQFFNLVQTLTVLENLLLPLELNGRTSAGDRAAALDLLAQVGLADRRDAYPDRLSGGEQQRIAVARALVHDPQLVLADEPTGNLDEETGQQVLELLDRLTRRAGKNLLMVTHSPDVVGLADRVFRMTEGHLVEEFRSQNTEARSQSTIRQSEQHIDVLRALLNSDS